MKAIIRNIAIYAFILYFLPSLIPGLEISEGWMTLLLGGLVLTFIFFIIKPILNIISFPVGFIGLIFFSTITNLIALYFLTIFINGISIEPFTYQKAEILGFVTPKIIFNMFFAYVYTAFVLSFTDNLISWLIKK